ncbi:MAG: 3-deoxy-7-phosphoheptulonate synthase [Erysipelotrichaceae bacterium]|nr:3-deoxy-7-phosphoheptulonate synthase [Erysipelotrichaceae bacterium]MBR2791867.1 3-deoxy-7-phosphoheptulonate synthase [Erysipelotrichaceae bacterium]MBR2825927.1 3-deoxy-7-phosphoheptulonate synthase [Erysipelotrichaceae bacterium]MBR3350941.1 3-deoxy-7-phosphoheptulonate synthase [Erysipelotrichaceae bacterium]MBR6957133.1 3-deoxy-7-phosphoheptulonate synthase [Erysipelotrichaceae bacterium]
MIITLKKNIPQSEMDRLISSFEEKGLRINLSHGDMYTVLGLVGDTTGLYERDIQANEWVENVQRVQAPYKLANRLFHPEDTIVDVGGIKIGRGQKLAVMAGPCAVESEDSINEIAAEVRKAGADILRGGAYKPRTSPYSFQGLGYKGIKIMKEAGNRNGMPIVTEIMASQNMDEFIENVDLVQIGARNMQNFDLLRAVGHINKPVLLKRGMSATIEEWIMAAEYIMANGNPNVILCERGIRTFEKATRFTMDLAVIPLLREKTHLPIVIDPSHATGDWKLIEPVAMAAVAAGADGLIVEVHNHPEEALSDGAQSLKPEKFAAMMEKIRKVAEATGREF